MANVNRELGQVEVRGEEAESRLGRHGEHAY
jgi:hypothetical protein